MCNQGGLGGEQEEEEGMGLGLDLVCTCHGRLSCLLRFPA